MSDVHRVTAKRVGKFWELDIEGVGVTQARKLSQAEKTVRDYVHRDFDVAPDSFGITWSYDLGPDYESEMKAAKDAMRFAAEAQIAAAQRTRTVVARLTDDGLSGYEVAMVLGVSPQRVSQLLGRRGRRTRIAG